MKTTAKIKLPMFIFLSPKQRDIMLIVCLIYLILTSLSDPQAMTRVYYEDKLNNPNLHLSPRNKNTIDDDNH